MWPHYIAQVPHCTYTKLKVNKWGSEFASISYVIYKHIKCANNILADAISILRSVYSYDSLDITGKEKSLDMIFLKNFPQ